MSNMYYMIVALSREFSFAMRPHSSPQEKEFHRFTDWRTRRCSNIAILTKTPDAALLGSDSEAFLEFKASVFNQHGYRARILNKEEFDQFNDGIMAHNGAHARTKNLN